MSKEINIKDGKETKNTKDGQPINKDSTSAKPDAQAETYGIRNTLDAITGFGRALSSFSSVATSYIINTKDAGRGLEQMSQGKLIELADLVHDVFHGDDLLEPPSICTIGSQSAGKSMALNSICGIDILPNGKSIVTRTPVHIRLMHSNLADHIKVEFFEYSNSTDSNAIQKILSSFKVDLTCPVDQLQPIRDEIEKITERYAGKHKNVVDRPINIRITSPKVPNLSIIDLPGMTNIALRDKGQPEDIKHNIERILVRYISSPRTIILAIIPSTFDVEADMGLGLIKQYDKNFDRTIGVLTKTDLLTDSDVERYLINSISKDLQVRYGYFAVRNRSSDEVKNYTVEEGYGLEAKFFTSHPVYSKSEAKDRMGSINLANRLSAILISHLKACLPSVIEEIRKFDKNLDSRLDEIGRDYPQDAEAKRSVMNILISEFQKSYDLSITGRGAEFNTGSQIKKAIGSMKKECSALNPFIPSIYTDSKIREIIDDYDGIHMTSSAISTGVIEALFQGTEDPHPFFNRSASANALTHPSLGNYKGRRISSDSFDGTDKPSRPVVVKSARPVKSVKHQPAKPKPARPVKTQPVKSANPKPVKSVKPVKESGSGMFDLFTDSFGLGNEEEQYEDAEIETDESSKADDIEYIEYDYDYNYDHAETDTDYTGLSSADYTESDIDVRRCDPLTVLIDPYRTCMRSVQHRLIDLASDILGRERFARFPKLCDRIRDIVSNSIVPRRYQEVIADIEKRIIAEKRCIWTDNMEFNTKVLPAVVNSHSNASTNTKSSNTGSGLINPNTIRRVLHEYFKIINSDIMTHIHKQIVAFFVMEVVSDVNTGLNDKILDKTTIDVLLEENKDKAAKRAELYSLKKKIDMIKSMIGEMQ